MKGNLLRDNAGSIVCPSGKENDTSSTSQSKFTFGWISDLNMKTQTDRLHDNVPVNVYRKHFLHDNTKAPTTKDPSEILLTTELKNDV